MQRDELDVLIDKTATLMAQYGRRGALIDARLHALGGTLQDLTARLPGVVRDSTDAMLQSLLAQMTDVVRAGLERPLEDYRGSLHRAGAELDRATHALARRTDQLRTLHRLPIWKTLGAFAIALVLLVGGGGWLSAHYVRVIRDNQLAADLVLAYNRADVVLCGHHELCARVDAKGVRYGDRGQYLRVELRPDFPRHPSPVMKR